MGKKDFTNDIYTTDNILNKDNILIFGLLMLIGTLAKYGFTTMNLDEQHLAALSFTLFIKLFPRKMLFPKLLFLMYMMPGVSNISGSGDLADCSPDDVIEKNIWYGLDRAFLQAGRVNEKNELQSIRTFVPQTFVLKWTFVPRRTFHCPDF